MIYRAYGLTLASSVEIPPLRPGFQPACDPDVQIDVGPRVDWAAEALALPARTVPISPPRVREDDPRFTLQERGGGLFFELAYGDGTRFLVDRQATRVWGEAGPGLTVDDVFVYLLGPVMGFVLRRRGHIPLHASAVAFGAFAAALVGSAGAGKSTTAAALAGRGWPVLCEDVCHVMQEDGAVHVLPGYPRICLWPDSVDFLYASPEALPLIVHGWEKRFLALDEVQAKFASERSPLAAIYLLDARSNDAAAPRIAPVSLRPAALELLQNTYMNWLLDRQQRAAEFQAIADLVSLAPCFRVTPSCDPLRLGAMAELIESHALSLPSP